LLESGDYGGLGVFVELEVGEGCVEMLHDVAVRSRVTGVKSVCRWVLGGRGINVSMGSGRPGIDVTFATTAKV
jgi:hypothetical protein